MREITVIHNIQNAKFVKKISCIFQEMIRKNIHLQKVLTITLSSNRIKIAFDLWVYNLITQQKICIIRNIKGRSFKL